MCIYCGTTKYRKIYENHFGPIPKDSDGRTFDIHHQDKNRSNNSPENLHALSIQEHYDIHYSQGDWGACFLISQTMKLLPKEISRLATLTALKRVVDGKHNFQKREDGTSLSSDMVVAGKHNLQKREDGTSVSSDRVKDGSHHLLGGEIQRKHVEDGSHHLLKRTDGTSLASDRVKDGTNPFLDKEKARERALKRVKNGTHHWQNSEKQREKALKQVAAGTNPFQHPKSWKCEHCGKEGKGVANYNRYHGEKCKLFTPIIFLDNPTKAE